jgi:imidazolonepropionase-like amidohydrolase
MNPLLAVLMILAPQRPSAPVAFVDVNVIPMDRERVLPHWTVVVRDGKIVSQGATADVKVPGDAVRVDGRGKYLIPGLAEMHAHIPPGNATDEEITRTLSLWALNGVTTVRGMLGIPRHLAFRERAARGEILSPRIVTSGPSFSGASVPSPDSAVRMVMAEKALGYDFLKIHPGVSREAFDSMAAAASRAGIRFAGHVPLAVGLARAIEARYWSIDHLDGFIEAMARDGTPATPQQDGFFGMPLVDRLDESRLPGLVAATRAAGVAIVPTELFFESVAGDEPLDRLMARPDIHYVSEAMVRGWTQSTTQIRADNPRELRQKFIAVRRRILKALFDGGVPILLGSDSPQLWNAPGFSLAGELASYVDAGLTPYQALATGTRNVAVFLGNLEQAGTIQTGRVADLILLDGNPLTDIKNVARRAGVVVAGQWLPRQEIEKRLAALARP